MKFNVNFERCKGCEVCISACPKKILQMQRTKINKSGYHTVECSDDSACTSCALCATMCPDCAITIE